METKQQIFEKLAVAFFPDKKQCIILFQKLQRGNIDDTLKLHFYFSVHLPKFLMDLLILMAVL
jgi:hypothetical protein